MVKKPRPRHSRQIAEVALNAQQLMAEAQVELGTLIALINAEAAIEEAKK